MGLGAIPVLAALHPGPIAADLVHQGAVVVVLDIDDGPAALGKIAAGIEGAQIGGAQLAAATGCKGLEQQRIKPGAAGADAIGLIDRLVTSIGQILEQQREVDATAGLQAATQIGDQGGDARIPFAAAEEAPDVIKADAVDAEAIDPVPADIQDEFPGAAVFKVEVLEEATPFKLADERAIFPILVQLQIGKLGTGVIENAIHDHADAAPMQSINQPAQAGKPLQVLLRRHPVKIGEALVDGEEQERFVAPVEPAAGHRRPGQRLDSVDAEIDQMIDRLAHDVQLVAL